MNRDNRVANLSSIRALLFKGNTHRFDRRNTLDEIVALDLPPFAPLLCQNESGKPLFLLRCGHGLDFAICRILPQITVILEIAGRYFGYFPSIISLYHMQREIYARR